jgi:glutathione S-transferase
MTSPNIELSVLRWAPPIVHGLVRDLRVRWALEEAGLPYREHLVSPQDQKSASYRALQPFGQVPALRMDGIELFESGAIVQHIAEQSPALMPEEPQARADVKTWLFATLNSVETPIYMFNILDMIYGGPKGEDYRGLKAWVVAFVESRLDAVVQVLADKEYLLGRFTAADVLLTCVLRILFDTDLVKKRPTLHTYQQRCEARPAFQKALADQVATFERHAPAGAG